MIKWGIIGLGRMAKEFASYIKETDNAKLVAISSLNSEKLKIFKNIDIYAFNIVFYCCCFFNFC